MSLSTLGRGSDRYEPYSSGSRGNRGQRYLESDVFFSRFLLYFKNVLSILAGDGSAHLVTTINLEAQAILAANRLGHQVPTTTDPLGLTTALRSQTAATASRTITNTARTEETQTKMMPLTTTSRGMFCKTVFM